MEKAGIRGWLLFEKLDTAFSNPLPDFAPQETQEHGKEPNPDIVPKDGHGEQSLTDRKPCFIV